MSADCKVKLWSGNLGQPLVDFGNLQQGWVTQIAFSPKGTFIASAFRSGKVNVFLPDSTFVTQLSAHASSANALAWFVMA